MRFVHMDAGDIWEAVIAGKGGTDAEKTDVSD